MRYEVDEDIQRILQPRSTGVVREAIGPIVRAELLGAAIGDTVSISTQETGERLAHVVGFSGRLVVLSPLGETRGIAPGSAVALRSGGLKVSVGSSLLGSVVDPLGRILRPGGHPHPVSSQQVSLHRSPPAPLSRIRIDARFETGIPAIDGFVSVGCGQRFGVFAEPGVGKSTLMGLLASSAAPEVCVFGLIGERGREVGECIAHLESIGALSRSVVVVSTSDESPALRVFSALTATAIAEYFRDQGKRVLLQIDSLTRLLRAYREVGLAAGELPVRRGYPASVYAALPSLLERAGNGETGSITAFYTVLLSTDLDEDPMVEELKGLLDGHIVLSRELADRGIYPAVDPLRSISRLEGQLVTPQIRAVLQYLRKQLSHARDDGEMALLSPDTVDPQLKTALAVKNMVYEFLGRRDETKLPYETITNELIAIAAKNGFLSGEKTV